MNIIISQGGCSSWGIMEWANNPFPVYINGMEYNAHSRDPNNIFRKQWLIELESKPI